MDVRGPDGKMTKYSKLHGGELVKKGQIVIDKCPVRRVGKNHVGQPISKMESQERDLCKAFSIKAVSTRDGVVQDTAMLFKGEFCSAQGIEIRRRFKFKTTYSGFEISGSTPINGSGSFDKLSVRVHEKGGKIIPDPNIDSALDNDDQNFFESLGIDESNVTNKELAETQHFPESEDNAEFRVVVPVYLQQDGTTSRGKPVLQIVNQNSPSGFDTKELTTENLAEIFDADPDDKEVEKLYEKCLHFAHNKNINIAIVGQDGKSRRSHLLSSVNGNNELLQVETPSSSCRATYVSAVGPKLGAGKFIVAAA
jgi:hypothetical protein